jgi:hypothetical protein
MPRDEESYEDVQVEIVQESERAVAVKLDGNRKVWIPKSVLVLAACTVFKVGEIGTIAVESWFVEKEELI